MRPEAGSTDHKAPVKAWAECFASSDFATGDEKGTVALWPGKGGKPTVWSVFDGAPITGISFNATGSRLAVTDNTGWLVIWDTAAGKALHRVKRPGRVKAMAYGPRRRCLHPRRRQGGRSLVAARVGEVRKNRQRSLTEMFARIVLERVRIAEGGRGDAMTLKR